MPAPVSKREDIFILIKNKRKKTFYLSLPLEKFLPFFCEK